MKPETEPLISIVTVCYNAELLIEKTLQSVIGQTYQPIEYIVVDGKSSDKTGEIIAKYKKNIAQLVSEPDSGIYNAMNKGVKLAHGEWILFMNAGDSFATKNTIEKVVPFLQKKENTLIYGDILKADQKGNFYLKKSSDSKNYHRMFFCHQTLFCRTKLLRENPFDEKYSMSADFKFVKTMVLKGEKIENTQIPIAIFDTNGISNRRRIKGLKENVAIVKEMDKGTDRILFLMRLYFVIIWNFLRGEK